MVITELINLLEKVKEKEGDIPVIIYDMIFESEIGYLETTLDKNNRLVTKIQPEIKENVNDKRKTSH